MDLHILSAIFIVTLCACLVTVSDTIPLWEDYSDTSKLERRESDDIWIIRLKKSEANWELCPPNADRMRCFYSYLSLYVRMRNELKDPVALRNIGKKKKKRSVDKKSGIICPLGMDRIQCYDKTIAYYIRLMRILYKK